MRYFCQNKNSYKYDKKKSHSNMRFFFVKYKSHIYMRNYFKNISHINMRFFFHKNKTHINMRNISEK
jgi:hypothetical protein